MERSQIFDMMSTLKLYGMRSAYDEIMASGIKRQHEPPRIVGDLLQSEIAEKQARSIKYQITVAKLPLAKDIDDFDFTDTPVNEGLVRQLASGAFLAEQCWFSRGTEPVFSPRIEPPSSMFFRSWFGQGIGFFSSLNFCCSRAGLEAETVVSSFQDMASVGQAIE